MKYFLIYKITKYFYLDKEKIVKEAIQNLEKVKQSLTRIRFRIQSKI